MYYELCTDVPMTEVKHLTDGAQTHPREAKKRLAREIIALYHCAEAAQAADDTFEAIHGKAKSADAVPDDILDIAVPNDTCRRRGEHTPGQLWFHLRARSRADRGPGQAAGAAGRGHSRRGQVHRSRADDHGADGNDCQSRQKPLCASDSPRKRVRIKLWKRRHNPPHSAIPRPRARPTPTRRLCP